MADKNVALYYGNDEYLVVSQARQWLDRVCPEPERSLSLETIQGGVGKIDDVASALDQCIAAFRTLGLFGGKKVVWLREVTFFNNAVVMKNERVKRLMADLTDDLKKGLAPDQYLLITADGVDKRSGFYKAIKELGETAEFDIPERDYEARPLALQRARELFKRAGYSFEAGALDLFIEKTGFETRQIMNEVEKMVLFKAGDKLISKQDVQLMTAASSEAISWDFTDAVAERRLGDAIRLFRQLLFQKENPVRLLISIEGLFHNLLRFRECLDAGWVKLMNNRAVWVESAETEAYFSVMSDDPRKLHWFRSTKFLKQCMPYSARALAARKKLVVETHEKMLSSGSIPHELMMETMLAKLCAPAQKRR
jgi:DNA polymerase III subunit delta